MSHDHLATYLNDHLAGSVVAIELLARLKESAARPLAEFAARLHDDIAADRDELLRLMGELGIEQSASRLVMAWLAEKATQVKLWLDDPASGRLALLEALELVALGIDGKKALWRALAVVADYENALRQADFGRLIGRADEQRQRVEEARLDAARLALPREA
jgi:hypothetical protein